MESGAALRNVLLHLRRGDPGFLGHRQRPRKVTLLPLQRLQQSLQPELARVDVGFRAIDQPWREPKSPGNGQPVAPPGPSLAKLVGRGDARGIEEEGGVDDPTPFGIQSLERTEM